MTISSPHATSSVVVPFFFVADRQSSPLDLQCLPLYRRCARRGGQFLLPSIDYTDIQQKYRKTLTQTKYKSSKQFTAASKKRTIRHDADTASASPLSASSKKQRSTVSSKKANEEAMADENDIANEYKTMTNQPFLARLQQYLNIMNIRQSELCVSFQTSGASVSLLLKNQSTSEKLKCELIRKAKKWLTEEEELTRSLLVRHQQHHKQSISEDNTASTASGTDDMLLQQYLNQSIRVEDKAVVEMQYQSYLRQQRVMARSSSVQAAKELNRKAAHSKKQRQLQITEPPQSHSSLNDNDERVISSTEEQKNNDEAISSAVSTASRHRSSRSSAVAAQLRMQKLLSENDENDGMDDNIPSPSYTTPQSKKRKSTVIKLESADKNADMIDEEYEEQYGGSGSYRKSTQRSGNTYPFVLPQMITPAQPISHQDQPLRLFVSKRWQLTADLLSNISFISLSSLTSFTHPITFTTRTQILTLQPFTATNMSTHPLTSPAKHKQSISSSDHFLHCGGSLTAAKWAPTYQDTQQSPSASCRQYLLTAADTQMMYHTIRPEINKLTQNDNNHDNYLCLWDFGSILHEVKSTAENSSFTPRIELLIRHGFGSVRHIEWYPNAQHVYQSPSSADDDQSSQRLARLGVAAIAFYDGHLAIVSIPHPSQLQSLFTSNNNSTTSSSSSLTKCDEYVPIKSIDLTALPGLITTVPSFVTSRTSSSSGKFLPYATTISFMNIIHRQHIGVCVGTNDGAVLIYQLSMRNDDTISSLSSPSNNDDYNECEPTQHFSVSTRGNAVTSIAVHPVSSQYIAVSAYDSSVSIYNLHATAQPLFTITLGIQAVTKLYWFKEKLDWLTYTYEDNLRMLYIFNQMDNGLTAAFQPTFVQPQQSHTEDINITASDMLIVPQSSTNEIICMIATACNDGMVWLQAQSIDLFGVDKYTYASRGATIYRLVSNQHVSHDTVSMQQEEQKSHRNDDMLTSSSSSPILEVCDSYPVEYIPSRPAQLRVKKARETSSSLSSYHHSSTPAQLALTHDVTVTQVAFNPNYRYPRILVSGGIAGILRCQIIDDM